VSPCEFTVEAEVAHSGEEGDLYILEEEEWLIILVLREE